MAPNYKLVIYRQNANKTTSLNGNKLSKNGLALLFFTFHFLNFTARHYVKNVRIWSFYVPYFSEIRLNTESECGKIWTRKTPDTDTFHAVPLIAENHHPS